MPDSVSSDYGPRDIGIGSTYHEGIDLPISNGTPLNALGNGVVTEAGWADGGGNFVRIQYDNGYSSLYYHLENVTVGEGQRVAIGQNVGYSDNTGAWTTGPHLHMGIFDSSGSSVNPRDVPGLEFPPLVE
jgi:murein DD-endopeptidase MepM/ murein hydrolase activator NlpD